ncbi:MAG: tRNA (guanine-N(7)-)-methyltransferase non-catalytic subunit trm82 [Cirrosporium novae-zelandiae]|nr:MAG: tRNA (guanine-N(7)-)-methyltransferase non-catalytic subunit trm82 [Cirrosporium novae-zelandiae]
MFQHPFQCLKKLPKSSYLCNDILVTATGPIIFSYALDDGRVISSWPSAYFEVVAEPEIIHEATERIEGNIEPPAKKLKTSVPDNLSENSSADIVIESPHGKRRKKRSAKGAPLPLILKLASTSDGKYLVTVTSEDKCIRVFEVSPQGQLRLLSERIMPKRLFAVDVTPDDSTILCADKFGDVYSLPLLVPEAGTTNLEPEGGQLAANEDKKEISPKPFVPAASTLTVHTKRNLQALQNQLKAQPKPSEKKTLDFTHELLLGHVSMLIDVISTTIPPMDDCQKSRTYILTSDRDEHIRVSRGIPQTHVIERFCFGHKEFVSKLCVPSLLPECLISGGGDDSLFVWKWVEGLLTQKVDLRTHVECLKNSLQHDSDQDGGLETTHDQLRNHEEEPIIVQLGGPGNINNSQKEKRQGTDWQGHEPSADNSEGIAVSGIWDFSLQLIPGDDTGIILVACEGIPAIFSFLLNEQNQLKYHQTIPVSGNILDIAVVDLNIIISVDNVYVPGSTKQFRNISADQTVLQTFQYSSEKRIFMEGSQYSTAIDSINQEGGFEMDDSSLKALGSVLYNIERLRKRGFEDEA